MCKLCYPKGIRNEFERAARTYRRGDLIAVVTSYYRGERELYVRHSEPLDAALRAAIARYFPAQLLDKVKTITLRGARIPPPPFYAQAKEMSGGNFPDFVHLASFT
jgi:hypothetical protein